MRHIVDGSNLLGALGMEREADESKRALVRMLAAFARSSKSRVDCVFDGSKPPGFVTSLGALTVTFSHPRIGDDVIEALVARAAGPCVVVTSDRALGARLRSRRVTIVNCTEFRPKLESATREADAETPEQGDWESYFSDSKNRNV